MLTVIDSKGRLLTGEMAEWLKAHAWKACIPQGIQGSNPCLSANYPSKGVQQDPINNNNLLKIMKFLSYIVLGGTMKAERRWGYVWGYWPL